MKKSILTSAILCALTGYTSVATAQTDETSVEDVEVISVVGSFQKSLADALAEKRLADQVLEAVSAEDLGKLPDISIAESIARLPGVVANRDRGNATELSIRGLGPNLSNTLLNGREIATGEASRNIRYETYPSELLNGAYVFKSPKASLVEGGVGGTVDLRTIRPLDFGERRVVVNARGSFFDLADDIADTDAGGYTASISYVDQFLDETLGFVVAYSRREQPIASARTNIFNSSARSAFDNQNTQEFDSEGVERIPFGFEALVRGGDDDRDGVVAAVQWRPNDTFELNVDTFYSKVDFIEEQRGFRVEGLENEFGNFFTDVQGADGFITAATATSTADYGLKVRNVNEEFTLFDDLFSGGVNLLWNVGAFKVSADVGYSQNDRDVQFVSVQTEVHDVSGVPYVIPYGIDAAYDATSADAPATFNFNVNLADPSTNLPSFVTVPDSDTVDDEITNYALDVEYGSIHDFFTKFEAGVRFTDREKSLYARSDYLYIDPANRTPLSSDLLGEPLTNAGSVAFPATLTFDRQAVIDQVFGGINPQQSNSNKTESWEVAEKIKSVYVSASFEGEIGDIFYSGNIGVRAVETETQSSSTFLQNGEETNYQEVLTPLEVENSYSNVLPSFNISFFPTETQIFRFGLSRAIARAPLDDLRAGVGEFNFGQPAAFGGNPLLDPFETNQLDLTYEWYFSDNAALTVSGFFKDVETFIVRETSTDVELPSGAIGNLTQPINGEGGEIKGIEVAYTQPLTFLPGALRDFGIFVNYTNVDSDIEVSPAFVEGTFPLPGLAENTLNAQLWYFKNGFEARVGYRYRDDFPVELGDVPDQILFNDSETVVDFQMSYTFADHSGLTGLKLLFQANNVTDEPFRTYYSSSDARGRYEEFGKRYWAGFSYQF